MGLFLSITLPVVVLAYAVWLAVRMVRRRGRGGACAGGCASCPYANGCRDAKPPTSKGAKRDA